MHLFLTGITGFVGSRLARDQLARGERVSGIHVDGGGSAPASGRQTAPVGEAWEVDLLDRDGLADTIDRARPEVIVHLGGLSHVGSSWGRIGDYFRVNVLGTENLLAVAGERRIPVVFASSAEVYGAVAEDEQPIGEDRQPAPASPYALTKAAAERMALAAGAVVARCFNLVGAGQAPGFALPSFARQLAAVARGEAPPVLRVGNLSARRDFVHVADGTAAYRLLAERGEPGTAYNIASGEAVSIRHALERLMAIAGVGAEVEVDPERVRPVDVPVLAGDPRRLEGLGWRRRHDLDDALAELWREASAEPSDGPGEARQVAG
ncbi:MAG TPA: GDP-mannose 4,6-dehydratase [Thermoanaerobaculia bacterium]|nr:GDP-mannose 4,6-dehydratase [Thermoanaerobaculia bacterium]